MVIYWGATCSWVRYKPASGQSPSSSLFICYQLSLSFWTLLSPQQVEERLLSPEVWIVSLQGSFEMRLRATCNPRTTACPPLGFNPKMCQWEETSRRWFLYPFLLQSKHSRIGMEQKINSVFISSWSDEIFTFQNKSVAILQNSHIQFLQCSSQKKNPMFVKAHIYGVSVHKNEDIKGREITYKNIFRKLLAKMLKLHIKLC